MLADHVAAAEGKLYINGGAWTIYTVRELPTHLPPFGVAIAIHVPWTATNQVHRFDVSLVHEDGDRIPLGKPDGSDREGNAVDALSGQFNVGRPANVPAGDEQVIPLPLMINNLRIERPGTYIVTVLIHDQKMAELRFRVRLAEPGSQGA